MIVWEFVNYWGSRERAAPKSTPEWKSRQRKASQWKVSVAKERQEEGR